MPPAELAAQRNLVVSDVDGKSELALHPERAFGFRSGSPSHFLIDRAGQLRGRDVDRLALAAQLDALLAEK
ncbi:MAG: hypothetical protein JNL90_14340 [Planctomycetes bacterium]|nr:hypothetical protein [Planctomycetota bacterium]